MPAIDARGGGGGPPFVVASPVIGESWRCGEPSRDHYSPLPQGFGVCVIIKTLLIPLRCWFRRSRGRQGLADDGGRNTLVPVPGASGVGGHKGARPPGVHGPRRLHGRPKGGAPASLVPSPPEPAPGEHTHSSIPLAQGSGLGPRSGSDGSRSKQAERTRLGSRAEPVSQSPGNRSVPQELSSASYTLELSSACCRVLCRCSCVRRSRRRMRCTRRRTASGTSRSS